MTRVLILILAAIVLLAIGESWTQIWIAVIALFLFAQITTVAQEWLQKRIGKRPRKDSNAFDATYFLVALAALFGMNHLFPGMHYLTYTLLFMASCTLGMLLAIALFGTTIEHFEGNLE